MKWRGKTEIHLSVRHEKSEKSSASSFLGRKISAKVRDSRLFPIYNKRSTFKWSSTIMIIIWHIWDSKALFKSLSRIIISVNVALTNLHYKVDSLKINDWYECPQFWFKLWSIVVVLVKISAIWRKYSASTARAFSHFCRHLPLRAQF